MTIRCQWVGSASRDAPPAAEMGASAVRVEVTDTGTGIAEKDQESIWEEFRQLPTARRSAVRRKARDSA